MFIVINGDRAVHQSLKYDRFYVREYGGYNPNMKLFKTSDYAEAVQVCNRNNEVWTGFEVEEI